jgi:S1-C subfamily serine protease
MNTIEPSQEPALHQEKKERGLGKVVRRSVPLVVAGVLGAGVAVGIGAAVDDGGTTTIIRQVGAENASAPAAFGQDGGLSVQDIYTRSAPGVVQITATSVSEDAFGTGQQAQALGSGFVIDKAGHIITNYHVVEGAEEVSVNFSSGRDQVPAKVIGSDPSTDIAVLKVDMPAEALTPIPLGDSDSVQVGDPVVAIGNPFGLDRTVTAGIVSAVQREITAPNGFPIDHVIQTDAAINHGNSGGALLDLAGRVIGITSQIRSDAGGSEGVGFAIPSNLVRTTADQIIATGHALHAYLGIGTATISAAAASQLGEAAGVAVTQVHAGGPAQGAGLRQASGERAVAGDVYPTGGDVITAVDGKRVTTTADLQSAIAAHKPGDPVTLTVDGGAPRQVRLTLGTRPS